ncbi:MULTISPECIES: hypothetical protein [unclassified Modestobacter]
MEPTPAPDAPARPRAWLRDPWTALRVVLAVVWLAVAVAVALTGQRAASLDQLHLAIVDGQVAEVGVTEGLPPGSTGSTVQTAVWRPGLVTYRTEVWEVSPGEQPPDGTRPAVTGGLADELRRYDPGLRIVAQPEWWSWSEVLGWRVASWVGPVAFLGAAGVLVVLVGGPVPARATRWAWFWLAWTPVGPPAFLALSGPFPGLPAPPPGARRLTGGWAFLLSLLLGSAFFSSSG